MSNLGMGVMLGMLGGNRDTVEAHNAAIGKKITDLRLEDNHLIFEFDDGTGIQMWDGGQSCCEYRWMHTDDEMADFVGATFLGADLRDGPTEGNKWGEPIESQFLLINTSEGTFTVVNYNKHNGYYGGFWVVVRPYTSEASRD